MNRSFVLRLVAVLIPLWSWTAFSAPPLISDFSPKVGTPGDQVTLYGSGFTSGVTVYFYNGHNGVPATTAFITSDTQMNVYVPSGALPGPLGIQQGTGTTYYTTADFTPIGPGPFISDVSPTFGATNDTIIITGVHLTNLVSVTFGGVNAPRFSPNAAGTQLTGPVPYGAVSGPINVTTLYGGPTNAANFLVIGPGPYITGFSPISGIGGTQVTVTGRFFTGVTAVYFNGVAGTGLAVASDTQLQVMAPANVATGPISIGGNTTVSNFFVPPAITGMVPSAGRAGTNVLISGSNLSNSISVTFAGLTATNFLVLSNNAILARVPGGASDGIIRITAPAGSAFSSGNFTVQPTLFGFNPGFGAVNNSIILTGANFNVGTPTVRFNGAGPASVSGVSFGQLTAMVPAGATTGPLSVSTTDGSHTNLAIFYLPPAITSFAPSNTPPGTTISLAGQNFLGASSVAFNGTAAVFTPPTNNTTLTAIVPTNFTTGPISVTAPAGTATSSGLFYAAPIISGFTPTHGLPGTNVAISGQSLLGATAVRFNGMNAAIISISNTQIVAVVPNGAQTGPITVEAPAGTNTTTTSFSLDYSSDTAASGTGAPNPVLVGSNLVYTLVLVNNGPFDAPNVRWTNLLSSSVNLKAAVVTQGTINTNANPITGNLGTLPVTSTATITLTVVPHASGTIADVVSVGSDNPDPAIGNNLWTIVTTVQPLPLLSIKLTTGQVKVSWPLALSNYVLESRPALTPGFSWSSNAGTSSVSGNTLYVTEPTTNAAKFYRLHR